MALYFLVMNCNKKTAAHGFYCMSKGCFIWFPIILKDVFFKNYRKNNKMKKYLLSWKVGVIIALEENAMSRANAFVIQSLATVKKISVKFHKGDQLGKYYGGELTPINGDKWFSHNYEMYLSSQEMSNSLLILFFFVCLLCNALKKTFERLE